MDAIGRLATYVLGFAVLCFLAAPMLVIAAASLDSGDFFTFPPHTISLRWYEAFAGDDAWRSSMVLTGSIALATAVVSGVCGTLAGIGVGRLPTRLRRLVLPIVVAPLVMPAIVLAISLYTIALQLRLIGNVGTFVVANAVLTAPIVTLLVAAAMDGMDRRLEYASLSCGAGPSTTIRRITLPYILPTALAGAVISFLLSIDEVVLSIFLVSPNQTPLAVKMFLQVQNGTAPIVTAAATIIIVTSLALAAALTILRAVASRRNAGLPDQDPEGIPTIVG